MIGYGNKIFKPDNNMTRAEFATAVRRILDIKDVAHSYKIFNDTSNRWFEKDVDTLAIYGYISGYDDNSFKGDSYITRGEVVTIINKVLGKELSEEEMNKVQIEQIFKDVSKDDWFYKELIKAYYGK